MAVLTSVVLAFLRLTNGSISQIHFSSSQSIRRKMKVVNCLLNGCWLHCNESCDLVFYNTCIMVMNTGLIESAWKGGSVFIFRGIVTKIPAGRNGLSTALSLSGTACCQCFNDFCHWNLIYSNLMICWVSAAAGGGRGMPYCCVLTQAAHTSHSERGFDHFNIALKHCSLQHIVVISAKWEVT